MFCEKCGTENADGAKFCRICGEPIINAPVADEGSAEPDIVTDAVSENIPETDSGVIQPSAYEAPAQPYANGAYVQPPADGMYAQPYTDGMYSGPSADGRGVFAYNAGGAYNAGSAGFAAPVPKSGPNKARTIAIIAIAVAAILIVVFIFNPFNFNKGPQNPMAAMYDGYKNLLESEGFSTTIAGDVSGESFTSNIAVVFGEDVKSSAFDMIVFSYDMEECIRAIYFDDEFAMTDGFGVNVATPTPPVAPAPDSGSMSAMALGAAYNNPDLDEDLLDYINDPDNYYKNIVNIDEAIDDAEYYFEDYFDMSVDINSLISDNHIDTDRIIEYINEFLSLPQFTEDMGYVLDELGISGIPDIEEVITLFEHFFYVKCEERGFTDTFITDLEHNGGSYSFTFNALDFIDAFTEYLEELEDDEELQASMDISGDLVGDFLKVLGLLDAYSVFGDIEDYMDVEYEINFEIDNNRVLKRVTVPVDDYYGDDLEMEMVIDKVGHDAIDTSALRDFLSEIEEY